MTANAFLLISIGPIQDFIASARRCQDLWFGSYLLSHLSGRIAKMLRDEGGDVVTMIFPGNESLDDKVAVANKIAAIVPADRAVELGKKADVVLKEELADLGKAVFTRIRREALGNRYLQLKAAEDQLGGLMECLWVSVPCPALEGEAYRHARSRAEELLAARKNTRNWDAGALWAAPIPKSSLDGLRESVIHEDLYHDKTKTNWAEARRVFGCGKAERLSGVDLLKRLGGEVIDADESKRSFARRPHFHSTSHMAAAPLFGHFERPDVQAAFDHYLDTLIEACGGDEGRLKDVRLKGEFGLRGKAHRHVYDGALLYEGRLEDLLDDNKMSKSELKRIVDKPRKALRALLQEIGHREPTPYYAMLLADGDRMGVVIDSLSDAGRHARLSERLDLFARGTKEIVEAHSGSLIYAGGDDVLALVPLHRAVPCAQALAKSFNEKLAEFTTKHDGQDVPTLSVGVAIAHHLAHFADVRVQAKQAERLAKTKRNALAVIIDKRSGGERSFVGGWDVVQRLEDWQRLIADGDISHGFLREVEDLARFTRPGLARHAAPSPEDLRQLLQHELERIMARKQPGMRGNAGLDADIQARIRETLDTYSGREEEQMDVGKAISQLGSELYVALEIHRVQQLTKPPEEKAA